MATQTLDNVFSLADAKHGRRHVKPESVSVLNDCRDIALKRIVAVLSTTFDKIEDELFQLAEKSADREAQNMYLDARSQAREKRGAIEASFKKQFLSFFERKVSGEDSGARKPQVDYATMELSLVEDNDLEEKLAVSDIAKRLSGKCNDELRALSQRMGFLLSEPDLAEDANPMSPDTIIKALKAACDQMTSGYQTKLTVMRMVEQHMAADMLSVYRDINSHLVSRQILPLIRTSYRKAETRVTRKPVAGEAPAGAVPPGAPGDNAAGDIFATLQQLMAGGSLFDPALSAGSAAPPAFGVTTGSFAPPPPSHSGAAADEALRRIAEGSGSITSAGLVSALSQMQQQFAAGGGNFDAMAALKEFIPGESPLASLNILRTVKAHSDLSASSGVDVMTIDIVAMLFDYVFDDKAIPDSVKGLLARLQIPALKVAILDKSFFSKKTHPARRLLDALAEASVSFAGVAQKEDPLYRQIEQVVDRIHGEFDTDIQLFVEVHAEFEQFLATRETANAELIEKSARVVYEQERREMARMIALDESGRRTADASLPPPVAAMLSGPWARVLERLYLREGGRETRFMQALATADDLIWSVAPKKDADERKRLVALLPSLLKSLQEGMDIAAVEADDRPRFFASLVDCHAAAVKAGLRGESVSALLAATQPNTESGPLFARLVSEERERASAQKALSRSGVARIQFTDHGVEIEDLGSGAASASIDTSTLTSVGAAGAARGDAVVTRAPSVELKRGTWVEFIHDGGKRIRGKLSWISPLKGMYLFTNPGATEALSIAPEVLQQQFQSGDARRLDESSLMDRAVDRMVNSLSQAAHA